VLPGKDGKERLDVQSGGEDIDEEDFAADQELKEADPGLVVIHVVRLGIEEDLVDAVEGSEEGSKRSGLVEELIGGRASGHFDAEQTANRQGKEAGNHASSSVGREWPHDYFHAKRQASTHKGGFV
jgi:hypothetical protein